MKKNKKYLEQRININKRECEEEFGRQINNHKQNYIHIPYPSLRKVGLFCLSLFLIVASFIHFKVMINIGNILGIWEYFENPTNELSNINQLIVLYPILFQGVIVLVTIISLYNLFDFEIDYEQLIAGLIIGLISGLIVGLIVGLIDGLIIGLIFGLMAGLIIGLIFGLIAGLIVRLI